MTPRSAPHTWVNRHVLALLFVTLVWGATFPVLKIATAQLSGIETSALRFALAALCMLPWALRAPRKAWLDGAVLGALVFVALLVASLLRLQRHPQAWRDDLKHPVRHVFVAAMPVALVLLVTTAVAAGLHGP